MCVNGDGDGDFFQGRIKRKHPVGEKLFFYDIISEGSRVQILCDLRFHEGEESEYFTIHGTLRRGDVIGVEGNPGESFRQLPLWSLSGLSLSLVCLSGLSV